MGALTSNRKRDHCFSLSYFTSPYNSLDFDSQSDFHVLKKAKISSMNFSSEGLISSVSPTVSRIRQYPKPTQNFKREVHAPCRKPRFSSQMGNALFRKLEQAKSLAFGTFLKKDKEVIDVEEGCSKDVISDDSSVEELEILDYRRKSLETNVDDAYLKEKYEKFADNRVQGSSSIVSDLSNQTPKVNDSGKMLDFYSIKNHGVEEVDELPHKKLYESAGKRNSTLGHLSFQIQLLTKKLSFLSRSAKKHEEVVVQPPFIPLTDEEEAEVSHAFSNSNRRKVLVTHADSNIEITGEMLQCLRPGAWLNDEVINLYLELLKEREKREPKRFLKCHFFNTFFYKKLISGKSGYDFKAVRRWTTQRKIGYGLIECDKIFVPIHKEIHWCLAIINKKDEKFQYLDSLKGMDTRVLKVLARYYVDEVKDKSAKDIDVSSWEIEYVDDLPAQENGWDCGMFMIKYADFYSRGLGLCFNQEHMPYFRRRTVKEILRLKAE